LDYDNGLDDKPRRPRNDIRDIRSYKQLERVQLDLDSPRLRKACENLGVEVDELKKK
jgi:hypothetical protein